MTRPSLRRIDASATRLVAVSIATLVTVVLTVFVTADLARQPVLVTSLASSSFLLYYQPGNEVNRFVPLVAGHLTAAVIGFAASETLPLPYWATAVSISLTVVVLAVARIIHPPAISTSLVFAYRPHDVTALATFAVTLVVVVVLAAAYFTLRFAAAHPHSILRLLHLEEDQHRGDDVARPPR